MDEEPFCRHHEDGPQAQVYEAALTASQSDSSGIVMDTTCCGCESQLRRRERLTTHPNYPRQLVAESYIECDCSEYVLSTHGAMMGEMPGGWSA